MPYISSSKIQFISCRWHRVDEADQWNPECWRRTVPALSHLHGADPLVVEDEAEEALRKWQAGRCAMCGNVEPLRTDHDHQTRPVIVAPRATPATSSRECNTKLMPLGRYRQKLPAIILSVTVRYFDHFLGQYPQPEDERDEAEFLRRAAKAVHATQIGDSASIRKPNPEARGEDEPGAHDN